LKEKVTKLQLESVKSKEEIINALGFNVEQKPLSAIIFDGIYITNRCPPELVEPIRSTIDPKYIDLWNFIEDAGGLNYTKVMQKVAPAYNFSNIRMDGRKSVKYMWLTSKIERYLEHDKKVHLLALQLKRKGIIVFPVGCQEIDDQCKIPNKKDFLKSINVSKSSKTK